MANFAWAIEWQIYLQEKLRWSKNTVIWSLCRKEFPFHRSCSSLTYHLTVNVRAGSSANGSPSCQDGGRVCTGVCLPHWKTIPTILRIFLALQHKDYRLFPKMPKPPKTTWNGCESTEENGLNRTNADCDATSSCSSTKPNFVNVSELTTEALLKCVSTTVVDERKRIQASLKESFDAFMTKVDNKLDCLLKHMDGKGGNFPSHSKSAWPSLKHVWWLCSVTKASRGAGKKQ